MVSLKIVESKSENVEGREAWFLTRARWVKFLYTRSRVGGGGRGVTKIGPLVSLQDVQ